MTLRWRDALAAENALVVVALDRFLVVERQKGLQGFLGRAEQDETSIAVRQQLDRNGDPVLANAQDTEAWAQRSFAWPFDRPIEPSDARPATARTPFLTGL